MSVDSKAEANSLLKFGIGVAKGHHGWGSSTQRKYRLILVRSLISRLRDSGFSWQAKILEYWQHRCMKSEFDQDKNKDPCTRVASDPPSKGEEGPH